MNVTVHPFLNFRNETETLYNFTGNVIESKRVHTKTYLGTTVTVLDNFSYDYNIRLLKHLQKVNDAEQQLIVYNRYNEFGQLDQKKVGGDGRFPTPYRFWIGLQTVDYAYNIRGWLKSINDPMNLGTDLFAFKVGYDNLYNGIYHQHNGKAQMIIFYPDTIINMTTLTG